MNFIPCRSIFAVLLLVSLALWAVAASAETAKERGAYLVQGIVACGNCHTTRGANGAPIPGMELAGMADFFEVPEFSISTPNITPDPETGIGNWTDDQIIAAIREGRHADGSTLGPFMPFDMYRGISDTDVEAIVAYLRQLTPVRHEVPRSVFHIPIPENYGPPVNSVPDVSRDDPVVWGEYLAGPLGHCMECHTPMGPEGFDYENRLGAGGNLFPGPWGLSTSANITPSALRDRTDEALRNAITRGIRPDGSPMLPPMGFSYYANIADGDLDAIVAYLRSLPPK